MEFLIAFFPVYVFFLCLIQVTILFSVRLIVESAVMNAARTAAVVFGDFGKKKHRDYQGEDLHKINKDNSKRRDAVRKAALISLAPLILNGVIQKVTLVFPPPQQPLGNEDDATDYTSQRINKGNIGKIRVRLEVEALCKIGFANRIACPTNRIYESIVAPLPGFARNQIFRPVRIVRAEAIYPYQGARYELDP